MWCRCGYTCYWKCKYNAISVFLDSLIFKMDKDFKNPQWFGLYKDSSAELGRHRVVIIHRNSTLAKICDNNNYTEIMVYFWQRKKVSAQTLVVPKTLSSQTYLPPQSPSEASPQSTSTLRTGQACQLNKIQPGSEENSGLSAGNIISGSSSSNYNPPNIIQQISPVYMLDRLSEYSRRKRESDRRRVAQRELDNLNMKIDKLLLKMEDTESHSQSRLTLEDECVVCLADAATMQTFPCGHKVVCRKCLIKTIQVAVSQRCLPLRCVICRDSILTLHHTIPGSSCGAAVLQSLTPSSTVVPPISQSGRSASNPATPTSPTGLFSFITGSRYQTTCPRLLSPGWSAIPGSQSFNSFTSSLDKVPRLTHSTPNSMDEEFLRYAPTDIEAFVNSHNDALNLHKAAKPSEQKLSQKSNEQNIVTNSKRSEAATHIFIHSQTTSDHLESLMDSSRPDIESVSTCGSTNLLQKSVGAHKFLAKFLPKKNKRKCNWFRNEN